MKYKGEAKLTVTINGQSTNTTIDCRKVDEWRLWKLFKSMVETLEQTPTDERRQGKPTTAR